MMTIEQGADRGFAVRRNGIVLLRTATETDWQAMGNGLVLVFGADPSRVDFLDPSSIRSIWLNCIAHTDERIEIVSVRAIED